jgi:hypothetical protein
MDLAFILSAAEHVAEAAEHERSELPFFIMGGLFASFAVAISVFGFKRPDFPTNAAAARGVMSAGVVLMLAAVSTAVYVAL